MTLITAKLFKSGSTTPLVGNIKVVANSSFVSTDKTYVNGVVTYTLVAGEATFDLAPTDTLKTAYNFRVYEAPLLPGDAEILLYSFDAAIPASATTINFNTLAPQSGIRYDLRDSSLLTLARYLVNADPFINFLGSKLWSNKGTWLATTVYRRGDVVLRSGSSYQYIDSSQAAGLLPESNPTKWQLLVAAGVGGGGGGGAEAPVGSMILFPGLATIPAKYLRCDGSAISRSTYSVLFATIGVTEGVGNGTTTFNLPTSAVTGGASFIIYTGV